MLSLDRMQWIYTDAETGDVIKQVPTIHSIQRETTPKNPATVKGNGIFCGEVTMDASVSASGNTYLLYDQKRNIYTLNGSSLPSMDKLLEMHKLYDYMPQGSLPSNYDEITEEMELKDKELYDIKHELIATQIKMESKDKMIRDYQKELTKV